MIRDRRVMFLRSHASDGPAGAALGAPAGTIVAVERDAFAVAARPGRVNILYLQEEGRAPMGVHAYLNGRTISVGDRCEPLTIAPE